MVGGAIIVIEGGHTHLDLRYVNIEFGVINDWQKEIKQQKTGSDFL